MVWLDSQVVATALSTIRLDLGASIEQLEWVVNAYILSFAVLLMSGAALGDRYGLRRMFVAGLGLFAAASAACALAPNIGALIATRAVQGAGAALVMPLALALLSAAFPPELRGRALGIFSGLTGLALIAGPVVGGAITEGLAWQWIFWLNLPIALLIIPLVRSRIQVSFGPRTALDIGGLALITGAALGVVWGLMRANNAAWGSLEVVAALLAGGLLALAFVGWSCATASRWCRCGSSARAPSHWATWRPSSSLRRFSEWCSFWRSSCRPRRATGRSAPGCDCCPGPPHSSWRRLSPARWSTGSASAADRRRAIAAGRRDGLDRPDRRARPRLRRARRAADRRRRRRFDGDARRPERRDGRDLLMEYSTLVASATIRHPLSYSFQFALVSEIHP
jgi:hypothetical protein